MCEEELYSHLHNVSNKIYSQFLKFQSITGLLIE